MPDFKKSLAISLALHAMVFAFFLVKFIYFSLPILDLSQAISITIGDLADSSRLPEKAEPEAFSNLDKKKEPPPKRVEVQKEKPVAEVKEPVKVQPKVVPTPDVVSLSKAKQKSALEKLKKSSALDKIKEDLKNDSISKLKALEKKSAPPRIIAAGSNLGGLDKLQAGNYLDEIDKSIKQFWSLPQWLLNKSLKARALVKFNMQGQIQSSKIISSSGNSSYDQYCLKAIADAAPFPKVPEKLTEKFSVDGVVIGFPE